MTPAERQLIAELFDRLATLEDAQRDPAAEKATKDGLRQAPNAVYSLVQTALLQDEALKRADTRIRQLEAELGQGEPQQSGSFLGGGGPFGRQDSRQGSVPNVRPGDAPMGAPGAFRGGAQQPMQAQPEPHAQPQGGGGSFLGTAAAAAAGAIGGSLLLDAVRGMMGGGRPGGTGGLGTPAAAHGGGGLPWDQPGGGASAGGGLPWSTPGGGGGDLGRQAGIDDIGRSGGSPFGSSERMAGGGGGKRGGDDDRRGSEDTAHAESGSPFETASAEATGGEENSENAGDEGHADDDADLGGGDGGDLGGDGGSDQ